MDVRLLAADQDWNPIILLGPFLFFVLLIVFVWLLPAIVAALIAEHKDRNGIGWFFATLFVLGPFGVGFALIAPHGRMDPLLLPTPAKEAKRTVAHGRQRFTRSSRYTAYPAGVAIVQSRIAASGNITMVDWPYCGATVETSSITTSTGRRLRRGVRDSPAAGPGRSFV